MRTEMQPHLSVPVWSEDYQRSLIRKQSVPISSPANADETAIYRSSLSPHELLTGFPQVNTIQEVFQNTVKAFGNQPFLGTRYPTRKNGQIVWSNYQFKTYKEVDVDRTLFGAGLMKLYDDNVKAKTENWYLGIYSLNRYEWMVSDLGAGAYSVANVALYDTLGPDTSQFIINHSALPIMVTSIDKVDILLKMAPKCPTLKVIIVMESLFKDQPSPLAILEKWGAQLGIKVISFSEVLAIGRKHPRPFSLPKPDDLFCISYTSGTTGNPKGAMLSHRNMVCTLRAVTAVGGFSFADVHISYLPLAHIFERVVIWSVATIGASAGFFRGDVALLIEDIGVLSPTIFASVPRLLNRIHDKIVQGAMNSGSAVKAALFSRALESKLQNMNTTGSLKHPLWDPIVFKKVQQLLGGRMRLIITASAPISSSVLSFLRVATGAQVIEAYGQTESTGGLTCSLRNDFKPGHVGCAGPQNEIKLVSVPEMNYLAKENKGELWVRGPNVFMGYLKDKAKTEEAITPDGWLKTGDIATVDQSGRFSIVDRKKNIFKLAQGEYVAPEKLENIFLKSSFVAQIFVHGDSLQSELVGIVVPDQEYSVAYAVQHGILPANTVIPPPPAPGQPLDPIVGVLAKNPKFLEVVFQDLRNIAKKEKLQGFEYIKGLFLDGELFTAENGLLTPTFKLKRPAAAEKYRAQIDAMYQSLENKRPPAKL